MTSSIDPRNLSTIASFDSKVDEQRQAVAATRRKSHDLAELEREYAAEARGAKERLDVLKLEQRKLEAEIEDLNRQVKLHHGRLNEIQDSREYRALNDEIRYLLRQVEAKEESTLANMEQVEKLEVEYGSLNEAYEAKHAEVVAETERLAREGAEHEVELRQAEEALETLLDQLPENVVRFYRRRATRQERPVVWMVKDACGACQTKLTPQARLEVVNSTRIVICQTCARIIVASQVEDSTVS